MDVTKHVSDDENTLGGGITLPASGLPSDALPEVQEPVLIVNFQTGVSTKYALSGKCLSRDKEQIKDSPRWYVLRTTYGRERKASAYLKEKGVEVFCPTLSKVIISNGKRKTIEESRIPNIFFAYGTESEIKSFVYDNVNLPYLRFYYHHFHVNNRIVKEPLIVPSNQIDSLKIICTVDGEDILISPVDIPKFSQGQLVKVINGTFKGVIGHVARYQGQQRVGVVVDGLLTMATAYIPSAFLELVE